MAGPTSNGDGPYTYGDYLSWDDGKRWELIDGVAYAMTPGPSRRHQQVLLRLATQLADALKNGPCEPYVAPFDVRLHEGNEEDARVVTVVQPDLLVVCDPSKLDDRGCRGAPDFIIEIVSPSSASKDNIQKTALYERHGVKEYWILHPSDRLVFIRRLQEDGAYGKVDIKGEDAGRIEVLAVAGLSIDLGPVFGESTP